MARKAGGDQMSWYRTGTVAVTNGSKTVTGVGTLWTTAVNAGDAFALVDANLNPTGAWYEVESVTNNTTLVLKQSYAGSTGSNNQYCVFNLVGNMTTPSFAQRLATFFASFQSLIDKPTTTPTASSIPVADSGGKIADGWIPATVARLASPALTGTPTAPTAAAGTNTTQLATTAFVNNNYLPLTGGILTGSTESRVGEGQVLNNVKSFRISGTVTGIMKVSLPVSWTDTMMNVRITGYSFTTSVGAGGWECTASGYSYSATTEWIATRASISGVPPFNTIRLAHDGTKCCILLGTTSTVWNYPHVVVSEVLVGHTAISKDGWAIAIIASETGITNINTPPTDTFWHNNNDGPGSGLDADTLDGSHASSFVPTPTSTSLTVGSVAILYNTGDTVTNGSSVAGSTLKQPYIATGSISGYGAMSGTWKNISGGSISQYCAGMFLRTA